MRVIAHPSVLRWLTEAMERQTEGEFAVQESAAPALVGV
jgi:hypothetical protein